MGDGGGDEEVGRKSKGKIVVRQNKKKHAHHNTHNHLTLLLRTEGRYGGRGDHGLVGSLCSVQHGKPFGNRKLDCPVWHHNIFSSR